jgi:hypothetical protein
VRRQVQTEGYVARALHPQRCVGPEGVSGPRLGGPLDYLCRVSFLRALDRGRRCGIHRRFIASCFNQGDAVPGPAFQGLRPSTKGGELVQGRTGADEQEHPTARTDTDQTLIRPVGGSSRDSLAGAGWTCSEAGKFRGLYPPGGGSSPGLASCRSGDPGTRYSEAFSGTRPTMSGAAGWIYNTRQGSFSRIS